MSNPNIPIDKQTNAIQFIGLIGGVIAAMLVYYIMPSNAGEIALAAANGKTLNVNALPIVAAVAVLMGIWWMTEAIALPATALLPMVLFPILGVDTFKNAAAPYASDTIYLFMGGFVLALAMQKWNLHTRIALGIVLLVGTSPRRLVAGFMIASGFMSMWVSNTATAVMMLPVGLSVLHLVSKLTGKDNELKQVDANHMDEVARQGTQGGFASAVIHKGKDVVSEIKDKTAAYTSNFGIALMLGIAYAASVGSLGTIIGTPPNALLVAHMKNEFGIEIGFGEWMLMGVPLSIIMLIACWALLVYVLFKPEISEIPGGKEVIHQEYKKLGTMSRAEWLVGGVFVLAALCWIFLGFIFKHYGIKVASLDSVIAMSVAVLLFIIPANSNHERLIDWDTAKKLPWDILILFGGGLALSAQFSKTGLSLWIGHQVSALGFMPIVLIILIVTALVIFLTEITSNTATAAAFLPVIAGVAIGLGYEGQNIMLFTVPVALAATCAFMLPVATPPNAIAYGSGYVRISDMIKAGLWLNIIAIFLITLTIIFLTTTVFGLNI
ncbi:MULTISPECIES: SLC13 family permease [Campylobacter]|uniref:DASS family sodium-coupled anion symporter n=1 Tax=Campylobacter lanienae TaxID=75658 RepID=A0ABY3G7Q2_9BACT|nr:MULTISPECIES: DASS family sodium-coupled anion symporter [Campylobacter]MCI7363805.1 DASS family sodium-coupled anion symporter [Campylobacter lanienae]MDD5785788.1 DASS family sodium-coupled anion symporter [Campylobacter lanienae]TWO13134.1 DASS family sodium-coupled anion symporter [Campylobacter lanienae]TWO28382.1 DASS family sodium-coupled anion symporter [Campylobacter lanienae]